MSNLKIKPVEKSGLFFNQYRYSVKFELNELGVLRGLNLNKIDQIVKERNAWRSEHRGLYSGYKSLINEHDVNNLKIVGALLKHYQQDIKFTISYHSGYVYTNNIEVLEKIYNLECIDSSRVHAQEAVQVCPSGTIALRNPQWTHRTYFKSKTVTDIQRDTLINYLNGRENVRLSPGLKQWTITRASAYWKTWIQDYYFIDHNNDGEVLFLNMVVPRITGRTLNIVAK